MLRFVLRRKLVAGALITFTVLAALATTTATGAIDPLGVNTSSTLDTCGYNPSAAPKPGGGTVVFDENTVTRAIGFFGVGLSGHVGVFANDESGLLIGAGGTPSSSAGSTIGTLNTAIANGSSVSSISVASPGLSAAISSGNSIVLGPSGSTETFTASAAAAKGATSISVTTKSAIHNFSSGANIADTNIVWGQAVPPTFGGGSDAQGRAVAPVIYLTDITSDSSAKGGDYEQGGTAANAGSPPFASALYGSWSPTVGSTPVNKNNWDLGPNADPIPATDAFGGTTTSFNEGYGSEVAWNVGGLKAWDPSANNGSGGYVALQPGHTYRAQSLTHDTDQNHTSGGGDVGEVCTTFHVPGPSLSITKTADKSPVNAGDQIGFTVEVKNTGDGDATGAAVSDSLPAGSGSGVTWAVDNSVGTPTKFVLSGAQGSQTLSLASTTLPAGADYKVHITATTSASECSTYDNQATLSASNAASAGPASAEEVCHPANIQIAKTADAAQVSAGDQIGFTLTVYNSGSGDAHGVKVNDTLPSNAGLSWSVAGQGAGWASSCSITSGVLSCGGANGVTVPANTTRNGSTFTVHVISGTTAATGGVCPGGSGVVNNTGNVTTTNDGSGQASASTCVAAPGIHIVKTADATQVSAGQQIGFTLTVYNDGAGDATGVKLSDPLPNNAGLSWSVDSQGAGWGSSCAIAGGTLTCGGASGVTVPAGTTQAASTFTVHVVSPTTQDSGGTCPGGSGVVDNTGTVTAGNGGSDQSSASTCIASPGIHIVKTADAPEVSAGSPIGFTLTVYNDGAGDATGVKLSDTLPTNAGLSWSIDSQGAGWASSCSIAGGVLSCGGADGVTVPAGTTLAGSTFTVHITSPTTEATGGVCPEGNGVVDNTVTVTTGNGGSDESNASTCVALANIHVVKTADALQVKAGSQIGFTLTVYNDGAGDATGVKLTDPLPANAGLAWSIASQGSGWGGSCAIANAVLTCGGANGVTVPAGTTIANSTFTVHVVSGTTAATGGSCPNSGVVNNTGSVTAGNGGSDQSSASTCVQQNLIDLGVTKSGSPNPDTLPGNITWMMVVTNNGPDTATGVTIADPMPSGNTFVSATTTQGSCTGGALLNCSIGTMAPGASVTITLVTKPSVTGTVTNTVTVVGNQTETSYANNTASASVVVVGPHTPPPVFCVAVSKVTPSQLFVGRKTTLTIHLTRHGQAVKGVRVLIKGGKLNMRTQPSNSKGVITLKVRPTKAGIVVFTPLASPHCGTKRLGVTGVFTPPVTG